MEARGLTPLRGRLRRHWSVGALRRTLLAPLPSILRHKHGALLNSIVQEPTYASKAGGRRRGITSVANSSSERVAFSVPYQGG